LTNKNVQLHLRQWILRQFGGKYGCATRRGLFCWWGCKINHISR